MITIQGKYTHANVMIDTVDQETTSQLYAMTNHPAFNGEIVIMPDCHKGSGSVIGFTMPLTDRVMPQIVGVN